MGHKMFKQKSLDMILSSFTKVSKDLEDFIIHHSDHVSDKTNLVQDLNKEIEEHQNQRAAATKVLGNIQKIVGSDLSQDVSS